MQQPLKSLTRTDFLRIATLFEGGLVLVAYLLGWLGNIDPLANLRVDTQTLVLGAAGTLPLYLFFVISYRYPFAGLHEIKRFLIDKMGPILGSCGPWDLVYLGLLAGLTEEILFRGVLQPLIESTWGGLIGLIVSNLLFALAHWINPLYGLLAGLTGLYLGVSLDITGERNLGIPILIHAFYDVLAFMAVVKTYRAESGSSF